MTSALVVALAVSITPRVHANDAWLSFHQEAAMSVRFTEVAFRNRNAIDISVEVEAPIGMRVLGPLTITANSSELLVLAGITKCDSVQLSATDATHGKYYQTFAVAPPKAGRPAYLTRIEVAYGIASFSGAFDARTQEYD